MPTVVSMANFLISLLLGGTGAVADFFCCLPSRRLNDRFYLHKGLQLGRKASLNWKKSDTRHSQYRTVSTGLQALNTIFFEIRDKFFQNVIRLVEIRIGKDRDELVRAVPGGKPSDGV